MIDDEKIIDLFFERSEQGIRELDNKYGAVCHNLSYNIVNNRQDAEECVNDAYLGAWNAIPPVRPNPLLSYIVKIVRNISLKIYWRKEAAKRSGHYTIALEEIEGYIADQKTVEDEIEARELARIIGEFLDTLTLENRVIFMRRYWFSDSYKDIAEFMGLSEKNISVRLTRIREKMKQYLSEREVFVKKFSDAMSELDTKYVDEALNYKKKAKKPGWVKWGAMAACFAVIAVLGVGVFQSGLFGNKTDIATLDNGNEIIFVKSETAGSSIDIDGTITTRQLTETEAASLFPNLTVTAHAVFRVDDTVSDSNKELIGFEGKIENAKVVISTTDIALLDTKIVGSEESSEVNGTSVTAGYFVTDRNSVGEQNVIYYATFKLGDSTVYVENAGAKTESESVKNDLATIIQELINNGALDLSSFNG